MKELEHILKTIEHIETTHKQQSLTDFNRGVLWICGELKKIIKEARRYAEEPTVGELLSYGVFKGDFMLVGSCSGKVRYRSWKKKIDDSEQNLTTEQLFDKDFTLIGEALAAGCLMAY